MEETIVHGSAKWHEKRAGMITGSNMEKVLAFSHAYLRRLIGIRNGSIVLPPPQAPGTVGGARDWGHANEPRAIAAYELRTGYEIEIAGQWFTHPELDYLGGTPDGLILSARGGIEVKCPESPANFLAAVATDDFSKHRAQCATYMAICDLDWIDVVYFDPRLRHPDDLHVIRCHRDARYEQKMLEACRRFWSAVIAERVPEVIDTTVIPNLF